MTGDVGAPPGEPGVLLAAVEGDRGARHGLVRWLSVDPVESGTGRRAVRLAEREGTKTRDGLLLLFHLTRQDLANMTDTMVETTMRTVSPCRRDDLTREQDGQLLLRDVAGLRDIVDIG